MNKHEYTVDDLGGMLDRLGMLIESMREHPEEWERHFWHCQVRDRARRSIAWVTRNRVTEWPPPPELSAKISGWWRTS